MEGYSHIVPFVRLEMERGGPAVDRIVILSLRTEVPTTEEVAVQVLRNAVTQWVNTDPKARELFQLDEISHIGDVLDHLEDESLSDILHNHGLTVVPLRRGGLAEGYDHIFTEDRWAAEAM